MSSSPITCESTQSQDIPSKKVVIHDPNQLPVHYSSTPGGTLYSTTPGGTRIVYDREFLMNLRNSIMSKTPPKNMPSFPVDILKSPPVVTTINSLCCIKSTEDDTIIEESSEQFKMDM